MRFSKRCPVCQTPGIITRPEVKTCGSPSCMSIWRTWTPEQKRFATDAEYALLKQKEFVETLKNPTPGAIIEVPTNPGDEGMPDALREILEKK